MADNNVKDMADIERLNSEISDYEDQISDLYGQMGFEIYKAYRDNPIPEVVNQVAEIKALHQRIADNKAQIKAIETADLCPQCGSKIRPGMAFCSGCGLKLPQQKPEPENKVSFCGYCGAPAISGMAFCTACGKKF